MNATRFDNTMTVSARALPEGIEVSFAAAEEGVKVPGPQVYDLVLHAVVHTPSGNTIAAGIGALHLDYLEAATGRWPLPARSCNTYTG